MTDAQPGCGIEDWEVTDLLPALVDRSLVSFDEATGRYSLLETVRQYAREKLEQSGKPEPVRQRHRDFFLALAEEAEPYLTGSKQAEWLERLEKEHENLRATLGRSLENESAEAGLRLCGALYRFWSTRGYLAEGREWCERALRKAEGQERKEERAKALNGAGILAFCQGDYASARTYQKQGLSIWREIGDRRGIAISLNSLGVVACHHGDYASARAYCEESLSIQREIGDRRGIAHSLNNLGNVARYQGDHASAQTYQEESLFLFREIGDRWGIALLLGNLGTVAHDQGDCALARTYYEESLSIDREIGDRRGIAYSLEAFARLMAGKRQAERGARLWGAAAALREETGAPLSPSEREDYERHVSSARETLGQEAFSQAWQGGRAMTLDQAIELALEDPA